MTEVRESAKDIVRKLRLTQTILGFYQGITAGTAAASKALVLSAGGAIATITSATITTLTTTTVNGSVYKAGVATLSNQLWVDCTVTAAALDASSQTGVITVVAAGTTERYKIRDVRLVGGGTNFGAGGDRDINLTDGTNVYTTIANGDIESAPSATLTWGNAKVPFLTGTSDTATVAGAAIVFKYGAAGSSAHTTGSIKFSVLLEKTV